MGNMYQKLVDQVTNNRIQLMVTKLNGREGSMETDFSREIFDYEEQGPTNEIIQGGKPRVEKSKARDELTIFEPFYPKERLIIIGGGHIAIPLVEIGSKIGFVVTVVDDRPSFANSSRFPLAKSVLCESFETIFETITLTPYDYVVIITRGHRHDMDCLRQILKQTETNYLGMIGSKRRVKVVKDVLLEEGYDKERMERVCSPIGLAIGAVTPEEISVSIIAEIISRKRLETKEIYKVNRSDLDFEVIEWLAKAKHEPLSIVTVLSSNGSVPRGAGAKMLVYPTGHIIGSIGGGCSEAAVIQNALRIIGRQRYMIQTIDMTDDEAETEGMVCGGTMEVLIEDGCIQK